MFYPFSASPNESREAKIADVRFFSDSKAEITAEEREANAFCFVHVLRQLFDQEIDMLRRKGAAVVRRIDLPDRQTFQLPNGPTEVRKRYEAVQSEKQSTRYRVAGKKRSRLRIPEQDAAVRMAGDMENR